MDKKVIRVAINTSPLKSGHAVRGIGAYTKNLLEALRKRKDIRLKEIRNSSPVGRRVQLEIRNCDIIHFPYFDLFFDTLHVGGIPTVVTIFDVIPLIYPKHYPPGIKGKIRLFKQKWELRKVAAVITISETSKKDIVRFLDIPQEKIYVTHLAPGKEFQKRSLTIIQRRNIVKKYGLPESFVLYVGDVNYNKNVLGLAEACKILKVPLVIVGKQAVQKDFDRPHPENQPLVQLIERYGNDPDVLRLGFVPEDDLVAIYNLATVYCQPSFYEGFGLPVLEAMACGCPVVAGKTQALVEVAGDAAFYVEPKDYNDIAKGLNELISDNSKREELIKKGLAQVKKFSWEKTVAKTVKIYKNVAQK